MARQIFAYILHKGGVADDSAQELAWRPGKAIPALTATAVVVGSGASLEGAVRAAAGYMPEVWKIDNAALAYPNAEVVRKALVKHPARRARHRWCPRTPSAWTWPRAFRSSSNAAFVPDMVGIEGVEGGTAQSRAPGVWGAGEHPCEL
ncbi:MAG: hypothetical protein U5J82_11565 [Desulfobacterales bacterium]|nr:hypothetical protein [Desulfobacterales bacterium]